MDETQQKTIHLLTTLVIILVITNIALILKIPQTTTQETPSLISPGIPSTTIPGTQQEISSDDPASLTTPAQEEAIITEPEVETIFDPVTFCRAKEDYACPETNFDEQSCTAKKCRFFTQEDETPLCRPVECSFTNTENTCKDPCEWASINPGAQ